MMQRDLARKAFFNERAEQWMDMWYKDDETGAYTRHDKAFMRLFSLMDLREGDTVLDVGCGSGVLVPYILKAIGPGGTLTEVDYAEKMIEENRRRHADPRVQFVVARADELEVEEGSVSAVICFSCFPHFQNKAETLAGLQRALTPDGRLFIAHFDSSEDLNAHHRKHECVMHDHLPDAADMRRLMEEARLTVEDFIDEKGFYFIAARKA
ncbi:MAG: methyltransferase domain-containing protein [Spartobacteria bacterium]|nr:methyltransferase domain-containing protein [Spartobacteria bacterium]